MLTQIVWSTRGRRVALLVLAVAVLAVAVLALPAAAWLHAPAAPAASAAADPRLRELVARSTQNALAEQAEALPVLRVPAALAQDAAAAADASRFQVAAAAQSAPTATPTRAPTATPVPATPVPAMQPAGASLFVVAAADGGLRYVAEPPTPTVVPTSPPPALGGEQPAQESPEQESSGQVAVTTELMQIAAAEAPSAEGAQTEPEAAAAAVESTVACPTSSSRSYTTIPIASAPAAHPDAAHGDLNLGLRGWEATAAALEVVSIDGPSDGDPPRLDSLFASPRLPGFVSAALVYDWDWGCGAHGCRGALMEHREVMLLGLATTPGEPLTAPDRSAQIYGGGFKVLVLYADVGRLTLSYTRDDSVANGYAVHLEGLCVDPALVEAYRAANAAGRGVLPALRDDELLGSAAGAVLQVAVRDRGVFLDPRSRKDWWRGY